MPTPSDSTHTESLNVFLCSGFWTTVCHCVCFAGVQSVWRPASPVGGVSMTTSVRARAQSVKMRSNGSR